MLNKIERSPEINIVEVETLIDTWYKKQLASISAESNGVEVHLQTSPDISALKEAPLKALEEIAKSEQIFIEQMRMLENKIKQALEKEENKSYFNRNPSLITTLTDYLTKVSALVIAQNNLNLFDYYDNTTIESTEEAIYQLITSDRFSQYIAIISDLAVEYDNIQPTLHAITPRVTTNTAIEITPQKKFADDLFSLAGSSFQRPTRYKDLIDRLSKNRQKLKKNTHNNHSESSLNNLGTLAQKTIAGHATAYNNRLGYLAEMKRANSEMDAQAKVQYPLFKNKNKDEEYRRSALKKIIATQINTTLNTNSHYRGYVETLLVRAYPEIFTMNKDIFDIDLKFIPRFFNGYKVTYEHFYKAFGYELKSREPFQFNPERLDTQELDKLYLNTKNPLWLVLKSTKPVNDDFTAVDKVNTYRDLALSCINREVSSGDEKYEVVQILAQSAYAVASDYPYATVTARDGFTPKPEYRCPDRSNFSAKEIKDYYEQEAIKNKRFGWWVVNKYPLNTPLKTALEAPWLDSHIKKVTALNQELELRSVNSDKSDDSITLTSNDSLSTIGSDSDIEPSNLEQIQTLQKQLDELSNKLAVAKKQNTALKFSQISSATTKERLEQEIAELTEYANKFGTKFEELENVIKTYENGYHITSANPSGDEDLMNNLITRINNLITCLGNCQAVSSSQNSSLITSLRSTENPLLASSFFRPETTAASIQTSSIHSSAHLSENYTVSSYEEPVSLFETLKTQFEEKFKNTNSSGIKTIIASMGKMTGSSEVALGIILIQMQTISQERADRTLSKIRIMGVGGRHPDAQEFYNMMKKVDLTTKDGIDQAIKGLEQFVTNNSSTISNLNRR